MLILSNDAVITFQAASVTTGTTTITKTVDLGALDFDSVCFITQIGTPNAANILKVGEGALANGSDAADLANSHVTPTGSGPAGVYLDVVKPNKRYVTLTITRGSTTTVGDIWAVFYNGHSAPQTSIASTPNPLFGSTSVAAAEGTA